MTTERPQLTGGLAAAVVAVTVVVAALAGSAAVRTEATAGGRILAVPARRLAASDLGTSVVIEECVATAGGLDVRGRVTEPEDSQRGKQVLIAVSGTAPGTAPGRAVSLGFAASVGRGDRVGTFNLFLPWAAVDSEFGVLRSDGPVGDPALTGPATHCPSVL